MSELGEYWRDVKDYYRQNKQKYELKISSVYSKLCHHPLTKKVGDHYRIGNWDFWHTGTVRNYKTGEYSNFKTLLDNNS